MIESVLEDLAAKGVADTDWQALRAALHTRSGCWYGRGGESDQRQQKGLIIPY